MCISTRCFFTLHVFCTQILAYSKYATIWCVKTKRWLKNISTICSKLANANVLLFRVPSKKQVSQYMQRLQAFVVFKVHSWPFKWNSPCMTHFESILNCQLYVSFDLVESLDLPLAHVSPITRNLQSVLSGTSPQTPKSKMLNTWNLENRNLKVCLFSISLQSVCHEYLHQIPFHLFHDGCRLFNHLCLDHLLNINVSIWFLVVSIGSTGNRTFRTWLFGDAVESMR